MISSLEISSKPTETDSSQFTSFFLFSLPLLSLPSFLKPLFLLFLSLSLPQALKPSTGFERAACSFPLLVLP